MNVTYYALFEVDHEDPKYINVAFPDIFGAVTFGEGEEDAIYMAKDLLKLMLTESPAQCEPPSSKEWLEKTFPEKRVVAIEVDI